MFLNKISSTTKNLSLILFLLACVLIVNIPVISLDMMYPEQPLIYTANQSIHSWAQLWQVYLHPKMFHISILFFRPSGHFLMYQILMPLFGWHNTKALIVINLIFLALSGYLMIRLYDLLFPGFTVGGYLAFSIYLMHPALILSRLILLHFEFAYVFFVMLSVYCLALFCQKNTKVNQTQFHYFYLLGGSLLFYAVAITFKEPAIMLGPVLMSYFYFSFYEKGIWRNRQVRQILLLFMLFTLTLALYLSLQWPSLSHPLRNTVNVGAILAAVHKLMLTIFGLPDHFPFTPPVWRNVVFPYITSLILWGLLAISIVGFILMWSPFVSPKRQNFLYVYKKSVGFLYLASFLFLLLPMSWAWGLPWHLNLTLVFLSLIMGFSCEYVSSFIIKNRAWTYALAAVIFLGIAGSTVLVNNLNINYYLAQEGFALTVGRNAVVHPPAIKNQLDADSILVVEDSQLHDSYLLGASMYPFFNLKLNSLNLDANEDQYAQAGKTMFVKQQPIYNGSLFRWAYLMPSLQEEVFPFNVEQMAAVPDTILYSWLKHANNIFCVGYDNQGNWHDKTNLFKKNLAIEKSKRQLQVNQYEIMPAIVLQGHVSETTRLAFADYQLCQQTCDQNKQCKGFTYINAGDEKHTVVQCNFYDSLSFDSNKFCAACIGFIKSSAA